MPIISVTLMRGYDPEVRLKLMKQMTNTACAVTGAAAEGVTVVIHEVPAENYLRGGSRKTPGVPPRAPVDLVREYLTAMEARDLEAARACLHESFAMTFPGGKVFHRLEQLTEWARARYRSIHKTYDGFEDVAGNESSVVYCHGTLAGTWPDGDAFSGIRFIDRFTVKDGKLLDQHVWNDLAETRHR